MNTINVRFILNGRTIKRKLSSSKKLPGTQQLIAYVTWGDKQSIEFVEGVLWKNSPYSGFEAHRKIEGTYKESDHLTKYTGSFYGKKDFQFIQKRYKSMKIDVKGNLIKYRPMKINTALFILPESWNTKNQEASAPYVWINDEIKKITHIIESTHTELSKLKDFTREKLKATIIDRMKNGMPKHIFIPAKSAGDTIKTIHEISKVLSQEDGVPGNDYRNPKNVPDNLFEFIDYYYTNGLKLKKAADATYEKHLQFKRKLERWNNATGEKLSITQSDEVDVARFLKWRMYDNEENVVRNTEKVKSKNQITQIKNEAIAVSTMNKTKKDIKFFFNRSGDNFSCKPLLNTKHVVLKEEDDKREYYDVYLSMKQIRQILNLNLEPDSRIYKHRTLFILGCLGGGYRVSDLMKLPKPALERFGDEEYYTFNVKSTKTKVRTKAPIPHELNYLVEDYNFDEVIKVHDFRDDIKGLGELCGWTTVYKYEKLLADGVSKPMSEIYKDMLMPRTCRKTYCSLLYNFWNLPISECMEFSGHRTEDEFKKYLQVDQVEKAKRLIERFKVKPIFIG